MFITFILLVRIYLNKVIKNRYLGFKMTWRMQNAARVFMLPQMLPSVFLKVCQTLIIVLPVLSNAPLSYLNIISQIVKLELVRRS